MPVEIPLDWVGTVSGLNCTVCKGTALKVDIYWNLIWKTGYFGEIVLMCKACCV